MGGACSRRRRRKDSGPPKPPEGDHSEDAPASIDDNLPMPPEWERRQQEALQRLRAEFNSRPDTFLLSQVAMAVHFFKNFERDKLRAVTLKEEKEKELNRVLRKDHKSAIYLGSPYELMGEVMQYQRSSDSYPTLGHDLEYLILHDNVSVRSKFDPEDESDGATYKFTLMPTRNPGFARLRQTGVTPPPSTSRQRPPSASRTSSGGGLRGGRSVSATALARPEVDNPGRRGTLRRVRSEHALGEVREREESGGLASLSVRHSDPAAGPDTDRDRDVVDGCRKDPEAQEVGSSADVAVDPAADRTDAVGPEPPSRVSGEISDPERERDSEEANESGKHRSTDRDSNTFQPDESTKTGKNIEPLPKSTETRHRKRGVTAHPGETKDAIPIENQVLPDASFSERNQGTEAVRDSEEADKKMYEDKQYQDNQVKQQPSLPSIDQQRQVDAFQPERDKDEVQNNGLTPSNNPETSPAAVSERDYADGENNTNADDQNHSSLKPGIWMPEFSPYPAHPLYQAYYVPMGPFHAPVHTHASPAEDTAQTPHMFFQPMYVPPAGVPQPGYLHPTHIYPYPAYHPGVPYTSPYPYPPAPNVSSVSDDQMSPLVPGHFGSQPLRQEIPHETTPKPLRNNSPTERGLQNTPRLTGRTQAEVQKRKRRISSEPQAGSDPRRKRSLSEILCPETPSVCSEDTQGSFVKLADSTTDEDPDSPGHLPRHCFRRFLVRVDQDEDDENHWTEPRHEIHHYLSSEIFVNHFADNFGQLARLMARDVWLQQASANFLRGPTIFCQEQLPNGLRTTALITPTLVTMSWPEAAVAWGYRERPRLADTSGRRVQYQWPPARIVQELFQEGFCNLVPQGCFVREPLRAARHFTPEAMAVEWELCFQQAEMRLISSLEEVHIHCWAVAKLFFTHFLSEFRCLQERHIRHLMFWQFERNIRDWKMEALGGQLLKLLRSLERCVRERHLQHYFVPNRNLLESEAPGNLLNAQECLHRTLENPVVNVMIALSRLKVRDDAFPEFDWTLLFHYLTIKEQDLLKEVSPALRDIGAQETDLEDEDGDEDPMFVPTREERLERYQQRQKRKREAAAAAAAARRQQRRPPRRRQLPSLADASVEIHRLNDPNSRLRAQLVLDLLVRHFSAMAERLLDHGSVAQALTYSDHALNLCQLLEEKAGSEEAEEARRRLQALHKRAAQSLELPGAGGPADADVLGLQDVGGVGGDNWTLGQAAGRAARGDHNRQDTVASDVSSDVDGLGDLAALEPGRQPAEVTSSA